MTTNNTTRNTIKNTINIPHNTTGNRKYTTNKTIIPEMPHK